MHDILLLAANDLDRTPATGSMSHSKGFVTYRCFDLKFIILDTAGGLLDFITSGYTYFEC